VYLIHRRDELRASKIMADRVLANPKIEPVWDSTVSQYLTGDDGKMRAVTLRNLKTGAESELAVACVFVAIGHVPNSQFLQGVADLDENGYILQKHGTMTNVDGLFAAGDVADHVYRQAITAAGQGCASALDCERWLASRGVH
jgi:thioredoxin reductase (NADPH)